MRICDPHPRVAVVGRARRCAQNVVEYGLLIALIVVVVLLSINSFGLEILAWFDTFAGRITTTGTL